MTDREESLKGTTFTVVGNAAIKNNYGIRITYNTQPICHTQILITSVKFACTYTDMVPCSRLADHIHASQ